MGVEGLRSTRCALCAAEGNATELYPANFGPADLDPITFSARRRPDRVRYRVVQCNECGLVRSDPTIAPEMTAHLYTRSSFDYHLEVGSLARTYGRYLAKLARYRTERVALLEIGCGNGFFLREARRQGYGFVRGIEPSEAAVSRASPELRPYLVCDVFRPGLIEPEQYDVVCLFQVFDHLVDPAAALAECSVVLKPGGLLLFLNHNVRSFSHRVLRHRSPIIDIEHTYLYDRGTLSSLCQAHNFDVMEVGVAWNRYSLNYLARLLPLPSASSRAVQTALERSDLGRVNVWMPLGNLYLIAQKADGAPTPVPCTRQTRGFRARFREPPTSRLRHQAGRRRGAI
ncbi:MAG: class I SAM-dependent methyltransferase [Actinomycetota bacterium]|nr:class I SAM-dependent methyltransferase [Actinomycetota bacterium]MDQ6946623.1 class I SAM-dependent methyltransferase [Actinomycetota bacterium]